MKLYQTRSALIRKIKQTLLQYIDYTVIEMNGAFTAKFHCLSESEEKVVKKEGFSFR